LPEGFSGANYFTGHGSNPPEAIRFSDKEFMPIAPTLAALRELVERIIG
jgi:hypothetical protein